MSRTVNWLKSDSAATTAEYAIVIALVAAALILSGQALQLATSATFHQTALAFNPSADRAETAATPSPVASQSASDLWSSELSTANLLLYGLAWGVLVMAGAIVCYSRYRLQRVKRQLEELHCGPEPIPDEPGNPNFEKRQEIQRVLLKHFDETLPCNIEVRHVMSRKVRTVQQTANVSDLCELLDREGFHHLLVANQGVLLGVISDRDLKGRRGTLARHIMTASPLTVTPRTQVSHAISMLLHQRISCLPVVENGQIKGILTATDMLMTLQCIIKLLDRSPTGESSLASGCTLANVTACLPIAAPTAAC